MFCFVFVDRGYRADVFYVRWSKSRFYRFEFSLPPDFLSSFTRWRSLSPKSGCTNTSSWRQQCSRSLVPPNHLIHDNHSHTMLLTTCSMAGRPAVAVSPQWILSQLWIPIRAYRIFSRVRTLPATTSMKTFNNSRSRVTRDNVGFDRALTALYGLQLDDTIVRSPQNGNKSWPITTQRCHNTYTK